MIRNKTVPLLSSYPIGESEWRIIRMRKPLKSSLNIFHAAVRTIEIWRRKHIYRMLDSQLAVLSVQHWNHLSFRVSNHKTTLIEELKVTRWLMSGQNDKLDDKKDKL